jgi:DNA-binding response OmpR family regulator
MTLTLRVNGGARESLQENVNQLVVEDDRDYLKVLERYLNRFGFKVWRATNALEALNVLHSMSAPPAALVSDVHMSLLDGVGLVERIGKAYAGPIIHLTSDDSTELEIQALNRGAVAIISKSRDPRVLLAHLNRICGASTVEPA